VSVQIKDVEDSGLLLKIACLFKDRIGVYLIGGYANGFVRVVKRKKFLKAVAKELGVCIHDDVNKVSYYADGTTERY
jgi:hypothetical protein